MNTINIISDIHISGYHMYDYIGLEPFEHKVGTKKEALAIFHGFVRELPSRINELRKIIPGEIELDYTYESIQKLDLWLYDICDDYRINVLPSKQQSRDIIREKLIFSEDKGLKYEDIGAINEYIFRIALDPMMRSIATDLGIYFCECLRRIFIPDLIWIEGHHKRRQGGGHPRVQSTWFEKSGHSLWYVGSDSWIPTLDIIESMQFYTTYYNPDHPYINERSIGVY